MLSFEEFFVKKKIDLTALKADRPELYAEFSSHYGQMGERSFDHTKKYWFNKLRMDYKLPDPVVVPAPKKELEPVDVKTEPITGSTISAKPSGFKPRFKPGMAETKKQAEKESEETKPMEQTTLKPAGFKPRFKANVTKKVEADSQSKAVAEEEKNESAKQTTLKPTGFKPRFKAGVTKAKPVDETVDKVERQVSKEDDPLKTEGETVRKPTGFKPRFKAGVTKNKPKEDDE